MPELVFFVSCRSVEHLGQRFQRASKWLSWWTAPAHAGLIFPAFRASQLGEELRAFHNLPTTNNITESHNRKVNRFIAYREMPPVIAVHDAYKFAAMEMRELLAIRSGFIALSSRNKQQRRRLSQQDEYDTGRAPQTTREHRETRGGAAALSRKNAPLMAIGEQERLKALYENLRTNGLPTNSIVQVLNDQNDDDW